MPSDLHGPNLAARAVADYEARYQAGEARDARAQEAFSELLSRIRTDPEGYVTDCVADPSELLAHIFRTCAEAADNECEAGRLILRAAFLPQVRAAAEHLAEERQ
jgi:hypothetical protein